MATTKNLLFAFLLFALLFNISSCVLLPAQKVETDDFNRCSEMSKWRAIYVEGYFGEFQGIDGGYESQYPSGEFIFSNQPNAKTGFKVQIIIKDYGMNGSEKANRMEYKSDDKNNKQIFYDNNGQAINPNARVRITGYKLRDDGCTIRVQKIENCNSKFDLWFCCQHERLGFEMYQAQTPMAINNKGEGYEMAVKEHVAGGHRIDVRDTWRYFRLTQ